MFTFPINTFRYWRIKVLKTDLVPSLLGVSSKYDSVGLSKEYGQSLTLPSIPVWRKFGITDKLSVPHSLIIKPVFQ